MTVLKALGNPKVLLILANIKIMKKTLAMRLLEKAGATYKIITFPYDGQTDIEKREFSDPNFNIEQLFKTLVTKGDKTGVVVAVVPINEKLSLKKLSKLSGNKKMTLLPLIDLQKTTGYVRGGCSPLGMRKEFPTFFDNSIYTKEKVVINAGQRGTLLEVEPQILSTVIPKASVDDILL